VRILIAVILLVLTPVLGSAQDKRIVLASPADVAETEFWSYVLPRFKLKTGIKVVLGTTDQADVLIFNDLNVPEPNSGRRLMVHGKRNQGYSVELQSDSAYAIRFVDWLLSEIGQRTLTGYRESDKQVYFPAAPDDLVEDVVIMTGNIVVGEDVSIRKCGRCHLVSEKNKYGGIESTPSFPALRTLKDWREKFAVFWTLNPHPSFTQIEEITEPFDPAYPPHIYPIFLTIEEVENIGAFMETITPADLGDPIRTN